MDEAFEEYYWPQSDWDDASNDRDDYFDEEEDETDPLPEA